MVRFEVFVGEGVQGYVGVTGEEFRSWVVGCEGFGG